MDAAGPVWSTSRARRPTLQTISWHLKRVVETALALVTLVLLSPLWLTLALAVRASSRGPVLFRQQRIGRGGEPFELLKFRTMVVNGDSDITWSVERDSRITRVGRVLRRSSLDEVPQLINVLRGDMALVGPRPERPFFVKRFEAEIPNYAARLRVRPGITGWAQVHGLRGDTSIPQRVRYDNDYIDSWRLWLDVVILYRTAVDGAVEILIGLRDVVVGHRRRGDCRTIGGRRFGRVVPERSNGAAEEATNDLSIRGGSTA